MKIVSTSITEQITSSIREAIVRGEYELGQKLSEVSLSEYYQVSRTPVREALKQLDKEGLVEIIPRVGTCVMKPTQKDLIELFSVKEVIEGLAAGLFAEEKHSSKIKQLEHAVGLMEDSIEKSDNTLYVDANNKFHETIIEGSNNSKLRSHYNLLLNQIPYNKYVRLSIGVPNRMEQSFIEHQKVLAAIKDGDRNAAEATMRKHVKASSLYLQTGVTSELYKKETKRNN